jgi:hypothetical protein
MSVTTGRNGRWLITLSAVLPLLIIAASISYVGRGGGALASDDPTPTFPPTPVGGAPTSESVPVHVWPTANASDFDATATLPNATPMMTP